MGLGMPELVIIMVIALIVFGAGRLPEIGASLGKSIQNFKRATTEPPAPPPPAPPAPEPSAEISSKQDEQPSTDEGGGAGSDGR